jgi:hypothetical protein
MIKSWIESYAPKTEEEILATLSEIMQEVTLAALSRTDFFEKAAFYGGTALRIFHGLDRFSEDMDFSLLESNAEFSLEPYFSAVQTEFLALGMHVSLREIEKAKQSNINSAFPKTDTIWKELVLEDIVKQTGVKSNKTIKIKIEVDRKPPLGFKTEQNLVLRPFSFYVNCFDKPSLFAGKLHALLYRKWKTRVKGRDWYDFEWYVKNNIPLNLSHFCSLAVETGDWEGENISAKQVIDVLHEKIDTVSFSAIQDDVVRFIPDDSALQIWSPEYFKHLVGKMKFE